MQTPQPTLKRAVNLVGRATLLGASPAEVNAASCRVTGASSASYKGLCAAVFSRAIACALIYAEQLRSAQIRQN